MPVSSADITALSSPLPVPTGLGDNRSSLSSQSPFTSNQQQVNMALSGISPDPGVSPAIGSGNTMMPQSLAGISGAAMDSVGGNVAGLVGQQEEASDKYETYIPEDTTAEDAIDAQVEEFQDAEEGFQRTTKSGRVKKREFTGRKGARKAKKQDRKEDRWARQEAGLSGSKKRQMRRAQRGQRQEAWGIYKGEAKADAMDEAADLELL